MLPRPMAVSHEYPHLSWSDLFSVKKLFTENGKSTEICPPSYEHYLFDKIIRTTIVMIVFSGTKGYSSPVPSYVVVAAALASMQMDNRETTCLTSH